MATERIGAPVLEPGESGTRGDAWVASSRPDEAARTMRAIAALAVALVLLWACAPVFLMVFAGTLLALLLTEAARWSGRRLRLPYGWSLLVVIVALAACLGALGWLVLPRIVVQAGQLADAMPAAVERLRQQVQAYEWGQVAMTQFRTHRLLPTRSDIVTQVTGVASTTLGAVVNLFVILFVGLYGAAEPRTYRDGLMRLVPPGRRPRAAQVLEEVNRTLGRWLLGRLLSMAIVGLATGVGLWLLEVPLALTLGLIAAVLGFIPYVGPILAAVPAVLIGLTQSPEQALHVLLFYVGLQTVESYLLTPLVQRHAVSLPPAFQLAVQVLAGVLFGVAGLALATPLAAAGLVITRTLYVEDVLQDGRQPSASNAATPGDSPSGAPPVPAPGGRGGVGGV